MSPDELEALEIRLVLEAIYLRYGHDFREYGAESIRRCLRAVLASTRAPNLGELQHRLLAEPAFFEHVMNELTIQVSAMFRDPQFYAYFRARVVPMLRTYPALKVWHAGCAAGEEVYAMAIVLTEAGLYERTQIYATDVNQSAVARAREGVYPESLADGFAASYVASGGTGRFEDYFRRAGGGIVAREELRKNVVCFQHDLVMDRTLGEMQVIVCRNVLIYFGAALRERVLDMFSESLCRGGFLCLGASESLPASHARQFTAFSSPERIYRRGTE